MHVPRLRSSPILVCLALAAALTACGSQRPVVAGPSEPSRVELPADPDTPVVRIGRLLPVITADGRVFTDAPSGADLRSFVAPAPPAPQPVAIAQMTPAGVQAVLLEARRLGLLAPPPDYGDPRITDSATATITLTTADGTYEHAVYAPSRRTGERAADAARDRFDEFGRFVADRLRTSDADLGASTPYVPTQWIVELDPYYDVIGGPAPWPYDDPPAQGCRTFPLDGDIDTATGVYSTTIDGKNHLVSIRPALPFDDC